MSPPVGMYGPTRQLRDGRAKSIVPDSSGVTYADELSMSEENDSVLGNLPRSRPGVRSDKRASGKPRANAAAKPKTAKPAAKPKTARRTAAKPSPPPATPPPAARRPATPVGTAIKVGETVAVGGLKVAGRLAGEVLRRLPRP